MNRSIIMRHCEAQRRAALVAEGKAGAIRTAALRPSSLFPQRLPVRPNEAARIGRPNANCQEHRDDRHGSCAGRAIPSGRIAFGGAVLFIALSLATVMLRHWLRRIEERRVRARLSELDDLLKDIGMTRADVLFGNVATLARTTGTDGHRRQEVIMKGIARTKGSKIYLPNVRYIKNSVTGSQDASHV
jgi:uncharacterized protein YjiS (DUF1127 family)